MDSDDRDTEIFERIPWEALETRPDRRWWLYVGVGVAVAAAIGVSVGRSGSLSPLAQPAVTSAPTSVVSVAEPSVPPAPSTVPPTPPTTGEDSVTLSEADLMAVPSQTWEMMAVATAEWFVMDYFTRDGADDTGATSFVDFVRAVDVTIDEAGSAVVTVLTRRLSAPADEPYQRVPDEAWRVNLTVGADGWEVADGPYLVAAPVLVVAPRQVDGEVPPEIADLVEGEAVGATQAIDGWAVETEWTDVAGVTWKVLQHVGSETLGDGGD